MLNIEITNNETGQEKADSKMEIFMEKTANRTGKITLFRWNLSINFFPLVFVPYSHPYSTKRRNSIWESTRCFTVRFQCVQSPIITGYCFVFITRKWFSYFSTQMYLFIFFFFFISGIIRYRVDDIWIMEKKNLANLYGVKWMIGRSANEKWRKNTLEVNESGWWSTSNIIIIHWADITSWSSNCH